MRHEAFQPKKTAKNRAIADYFSSIMVEVRE
jgi:hypothetical protein